MKGVMDSNHYLRAEVKGRGINLFFWCRNKKTGT
jgi:hypothetical protein